MKPMTYEYSPHDEDEYYQLFKDSCRRQDYPYEQWNDFFSLYEGSPDCYGAVREIAREIAFHSYSTQGLSSQEEAVESLERCVTFIGNAVLALPDESELLEDMKEYNALIPAAAQVLSTGEDNGTVVGRLLRSYVLAGQYEEAQQLVHDVQYKVLPHDHKRFKRFVNMLVSHPEKEDDIVRKLSVEQDSTNDPIMTFGHFSKQQQKELVRDSFGEDGILHSSQAAADLCIFLMRANMRERAIFVAANDPQNLRYITNEWIMPFYYDSTVGQKRAHLERLDEVVGFLESKTKNERDLFGHYISLIECLGSDDQLESMEAIERLVVRSQERCPHLSVQERSTAELETACNEAVSKIALRNSMPEIAIPFIKESQSPATREQAALILEMLACTRSQEYLVA